MKTTDNHKPKEAIILSLFLIVVITGAYFYAMHTRPETATICTTEYVSEFGSQDCEDYYMMLEAKEEARTDYLRR